MFFFSSTVFEAFLACFGAIFEVVNAIWRAPCIKIIKEAGGNLIYSMLDEFLFNLGILTRAKVEQTVSLAVSTFLAQIQKYYLFDFAQNVLIAR